jgi:hypothetical protein
MRDSNLANPAKESAQDEFPHGLLDFCTPRATARQARPKSKSFLQENGAHMTLLSRQSFEIFLNAETSQDPK